MFFGKLSSYIQKHSEFQDYMKTHEEVAVGEDHFGPILLDVNASNFYKAWEQYLTSVLTGYEGVSATSGATKVDYISELPQILTFQLNRVKFDMQRHSAQKNNKEFALPTEIFPDRFMLQNKELVLGLRRRIHALETNLKNLKGQMEAFSGFGKNRSLLDSFNDVISFLKLGPDPAAVSVFQSRPPHEKEENIMNQSLYVGQSVFRPLSEPQHASSSLFLATLTAE